MAAIVAAVVTAVTTVVSAVVTAVTAVVAAVSPFVGIAIGFVVGAFVGTLGVKPPSIGDIGGVGDVGGVPGTGDPASEAVGVTLTKQGANKPIPIVYGFRRIGGIATFVETDGESNKYLYVVYTLCEGPIKGIKRMIVDDIEVPLPTENDGIYTDQQVYTVSEGRFANRMKFQLFYGNIGQPQSSLANESASWGLETRKAPGIAYAVFRFEWAKITTQEEADSNPYKGGIPQIKFDILGRKVRDCRSIPTGGSISSVSSSEYSFNPANCVADYMTNSVYGCGFDDDELNGDSFRVAANKFEETVNYSTGTTGRSMTLNAVLEPSGANMNFVKSLLQGARSSLPFQQGQYYMKVEDGGNETSIQSSTINVAFDVTKEHIIGGIELEGPKKENKFNEVRVNWIDPDREFSSQVTIYKEDGDLATDNNQPLIGEFNYSTVTNPHIAQDLARMIYKKSRVGRNILFQATQELLNVVVGDIIRVTDLVQDLDQVTFRVVGMRLSPDGIVTIEANEHDATLYPYITQTQYEVPPPLYLPDEIMLTPRIKEGAVEYPISIYPPNDPDDPWVPGSTDSAGELLPPPPNVKLPPISDPDDFTAGRNSVTQFELFKGDYKDETWLRFHNTYGSGSINPGGFDDPGGGILIGVYGEGLLHDWRNNGQIFTGTGYDISTVTPSRTFIGPAESGAYDLYRYRTGLDYGRLVLDAFTIAGNIFPAVAFKPNKPITGNIELAQIEYYQEGALVYQTNWDLRLIQSKPFVYADNGIPQQNKVPPTVRTYQGKDFFMPLIPNTQIRFRWIDVDLNKEYVDGSFLATDYEYVGETFIGYRETDSIAHYPRSYENGGEMTRLTRSYLAYSYKLPDGTLTKPRCNIEALMNYYNDMAARGLPGKTQDATFLFQSLG